MKKFADNWRKKSNQLGISSYLAVMFIAVVAIFVVAVIQSRLLLGIHRNRSLSDILVATYNAESEIYDIFARILEEYVTVGEVGGTKILADGTILEITGSEAEGSETVLIKANRPFAVQTLEGVHTFTPDEPGVDRVEIAVTLDCTNSMNSGSGTGKKRLQVQKEAIRKFINEVAIFPEAAKIHVGISTFAVDSKWLKDSVGIEITPDLDIREGLDWMDVIDKTLDAIEYGFPDGADNDNSPACQDNLIHLNGTNIGAGIDYMHEYFEPDYPAIQQVEIVVTDGLPNVRNPHPQCPETAHYCPIDSDHCGTYDPTGPIHGTDSKGYTTYGWLCKDTGTRWLSGTDNCRPPAKEFMECTLADTGTDWDDTGNNGIRKPSVDLYALTVYDAPPEDVQAILTDYAKIYLHIEDADALADNLILFLKDIIYGSQFIRIRRVIP